MTNLVLKKFPKQSMRVVLPWLLTNVRVETLVRLLLVGGIRKHWEKMMKKSIEILLREKIREKIEPDT